MTKTEYLFGHDKEHYTGIAFPDIALARIQDAQDLLKTLNSELKIDYYTPEQINLRIRMREIVEAINTWEKILELEN